MSILFVIIFEILSDSFKIAVLCHFGTVLTAMGKQLGNQL